MPCGHSAKSISKTSASSCISNSIFSFPSTQFQQVTFPEQIWQDNPHADASMKIGMPGVGGLLKEMLNSVIRTTSSSIDSGQR